MRSSNASVRVSLFALFTALAAAAAPASAANLLANGSFEGPPAETNNPVAHVTRGLIPDGWSSVPGLEAPDIINAGYSQGGPPFMVLLGPEDGQRFLDMNGATAQGGLFQDVGGLLAGSTVTLTYWYSQWAQNSDGLLNAFLIDPTTAAELNSQVTFVPFNNTVTSSSWNQLTFSAIVPLSGVVRVQFTANSFGTDRGALGLDNVVLDGRRAPAGVPEPATWAMMLLGFGLTGAVVRRRSPAHA